MESSATAFYLVDKECTEMGFKFSKFARTAEEWILNAVGVIQQEMAPYRGRGVYPKFRKVPMAIAAASELACFEGTALIWRSAASQFLSLAT